MDAAGVPLAVGLTGGNRNDVTQLLPLVDGITPVPGKVGRPTPTERDALVRCFHGPEYAAEARLVAAEALLLRARYGGDDRTL